MADQALSTSPPFRLFDLPLELRLVVYDHYFASTNLVPGVHPHYLRRSPPNRTDLTKAFEPPLLSPDAGTRAEALRPYLEALKVCHRKLENKLQTIEEDRLTKGWTGVWLQIELMDRARVIRQKIEEVKNELGGGGPGVLLAVLQDVRTMFIF